MNLAHSASWVLVHTACLDLTRECVVLVDGSVADGPTHVARRLVLLHVRAILVNIPVGQAKVHKVELVGVLPYACREKREISGPEDSSKTMHPPHHKFAWIEMHVTQSPKSRGRDRHTA